MEPGTVKDVEPEYLGVNYPIVTTVSPDISRYKEFAKNGGLKMYMPLFNKEEFVAIGKDMRKQPDFTEKLVDLYDEKQIIDRFDEYNGIIRHVLPVHQGILRDIDFPKTKAISEYVPHFIHKLSVENRNISDLIGIYDVKRDSKFDLSAMDIKYVNDQTMMRCLREKKLLTFYQGI